MRRAWTLVATLTVASCAPGTQHSPSALETSQEGWRNLFPGKDLKGWSRVDFDPKVTRKVWSVSEDGTLLQCDARGGIKELLMFEEEFGDGILHVEWRWGMDQGEKPNYNGGVFVRTSADGKIWTQAQVARAEKPPVVGDLFAMVPVGGKVQRVEAFQKGPSREKPVGEWNTYEVTCRGKEITLWVNGGVTSTWSDCPVPRGHLALQAEFAAYEYRSVRFKPFP